MAINPWQTTFDLIGLTAYITLMTGVVPDSEFLRQARRGSSLHLVELPRSAERSAEAKESTHAEAPKKTAEVAA